MWHKRFIFWNVEPVVFKSHQFIQGWRIRIEFISSVGKANYTIFKISLWESDNESYYSAYISWQVGTSLCLSWASRLLFRGLFSQRPPASSRSLHSNVLCYAWHTHAHPHNVAEGLLGGTCMCWEKVPSEGMDRGLCVPRATSVHHNICARVSELELYRYGRWIILHKGRSEWEKETDEIWR